jgi:hypothetical protein
MTTRTFIKNGYYCILNRDKGESYEKFIERGYFIVSQKPTNSKDLDKYTTYSRINNNIIYNKCTYNNDIHLLITEMIKNL